MKTIKKNIPTLETKRLFKFKPTKDHFSNGDTDSDPTTTLLTTIYTTHILGKSN